MKVIQEFAWGFALLVASGALGAAFETSWFGILGVAGLVLFIDGLYRKATGNKSFLSFMFKD